MPKDVLGTVEIFAVLNWLILSRVLKNAIYQNFESESTLPLFSSNSSSEPSSAFSGIVTEPFLQLQPPEDEAIEPDLSKVKSD